MSAPNHGTISSLRHGVVQEAKQSWLVSVLTIFSAWCGRLLRGSLIFNWITGQSADPPEVSFSGTFFGRLHRIQMALFRTLHLDRLLQGSVFLKTAFWCALPVIFAPLLPTIVILALVLAAMAALFLTFGVRSELTFRPFPVSKWVYLYAAIYVWATFTSLSVSGSLYVGALSVFFLLFYGILTTGVRSWSQLRRILTGMMVAALLVTAYGFWQYLHPDQYASVWLDTDMFSSISLRVYSTLANPNVLGTYFLLLIPLCAAMMLTAPGKLKKLAYGGLCALMGVCLILTYSRGCYLGLLFAVAVFLVLLDRRFLIAGIILLLLSPLYLPDTIISRFTSIGDMADSSTSYRVYIWMGTLAMLKEYWLCGLGPGEAAFNTVYPFYSYSSIEAPHAHNLFLQIVCDTGIVGLLVFLVLLVSFYRAVCTALRKETHKDAKIFQIAILSAISGFLLESMTDYTFYNYRVTFLFWAMLGLGMIFTRAEELKQADLNGPSPWTADETEDPRPLRVLNVISDTNIGGAGRCILNYLKYCDRSRYDVSVLLPKGSLLKPAVEAAGGTVLEADIAGDRSLDPKAIPVLRQMIAAAEPDIVHTHGSMSGRIAARGSHAKLIYSRHSAFPVPESLQHGPKHLANRWLNRLYADRIIAVSPATLENLTDSGVEKTRIEVVMNGVEALTPAPLDVQQQWRDRCGIREGTFVVGILARLEEYKGHLLLLEAARQLKDEGYPIRVLIAGKGDYEDTINRAIAEMDLTDTVLNLGFVTEVAAFLSILDVQVNCSFGTEASSLSLMEGFSLGLPAVVSSYGGNPWMVSDGENGLIFENRNSTALADCLRRLMDDSTLLPAMGQRSKEIFEARFTGEIFARNIESVYDRVCKK